MPVWRKRTLLRLNSGRIGVEWRQLETGRRRNSELGSGRLEQLALLQLDQRRRQETASAP